MKAAVYCRVSTDEQAERGTSLATQEERCRAHVKAQGWKLVEVFVDAGESGTNWTNDWGNWKPSGTGAQRANGRTYHPASGVPGSRNRAMMTGRRIKWDARKEKIVGDPEASKLLSREYRPPWRLA